MIMRINPPETEMPPQNQLRFGILFFSSVFLCGLSGCMATESQRGDTFYREQISKVRDVETGEEFYAFAGELDRTP